MRMIDASVTLMIVAQSLTLHCVGLPGQPLNGERITIASDE
jgi:hypothetical protein